MQIKNLSSAQTFGTVIASLPDDMPCTSHCCVRAGEPIKEWLSQEPVVLDYVSGMPLLVIYEAESYSLYYLDRVFKLRPGVRFSVTALDALCCFDICTARPDVLSLLGEHPAEIFYGASSDLKLERLYTFFYQECSRDFYFRGEQHEALELVYVDRGELHNLVGGVDILLRPQQMLLINRNIWHMQYADIGVAPRFVTITFDLSLGDLSPLACAYARARGADRMSSFGDFIALSDVCDADTARLIKREVSDGVIAPGYTDEALELLKQKKKGAYNIIQIDPSYRPAPIEHKQVYGITFEQGRNELDINGDLLSNIVTVNKEIPESALIDMKIALITLKYTQSNSVCYVKDGQAIGIGAGQQSRIHCTRLAGSKADNWFLRQSPQVLGLQFVDSLGRANRDNAIDVYMGDEYMDVLADGTWEGIFKVKPPVFTREEKRAWLDKMQDVTLGSDAFFPFSDNIERAHKSGVKYIAQPGGSVRDADVIACCDKYNMVMAFTGIRLFHH